MIKITFGHYFLCQALFCTVFFLYFFVDWYIVSPQHPGKAVIYDSPIVEALEVGQMTAPLESMNVPETPRATHKSMTLVDGYDNGTVANEDNMAYEIFNSTLVDQVVVDENGDLVLDRINGTDEMDKVVEILSNDGNLNETVTMNDKMSYKVYNSTSTYKVAMDENGDLVLEDRSNGTDETANVSKLPKPSPKSVTFVNGSEIVTTADKDKMAFDIGNSALTDQVVMHSNGDLELTDRSNGTAKTIKMEVKEEEKILTNALFGNGTLEAETFENATSIVTDAVPTSTESTNSTSL